MEVLIFFAIIIGLSIVASIVDYLKKVRVNIHLKKVLKNNSGKLDSIDYEMYHENIEFYKDFISKGTSQQKTKLPKPKLNNNDFTKYYFLNTLNKKYKYKNEQMRDVLFK